MADSLFNQPVVIDNGSAVMKSGFAGEEHPRSIVPSLYGTPKYKRVMAGSIEGSSFVGDTAYKLKGLLRLQYPMEHGVVKDWDAMESLWTSISSSLKVSFEDHPFLSTEAPLNPLENRRRMAQIFFETFNVPALYVSIQAVLALYSTGRTTGLVVDSGDGVSHVVPVYEGYSIHNAIKRVDVAGRDVTERLQFLLRRNGHKLQSSSEKEIVREIKEQKSYVSLDLKKEEREWNILSSDKRSNGSTFKLPDGKTIVLEQEVFRAPEILFSPVIIGSEEQGIHEMVFDSLKRVDLDLRSTLYSSIVLSGGSTLFKNFGERMLNELKAGAPRGTKMKIFAPPERKYSTWIGGSILANLSTFKMLWVSSNDYKENPDLIYTRCP